MPECSKNTTTCKLPKLTTCALTIAGSDSCGGAGIQADLKTFQALGVHGASVVTAVTAQNTRSITASLPLPAALTGQQLEAALSDLPVRAVKTGMLPDTDCVDVVVATLRQRSLPLIIDPVLVATTGARLAAAPVQQRVLERLAPQAELLTPNRDEAHALTGMPIDDRQTMLEAAHRLLETGVQAVLLKGSHLPDNGAATICDLLLTTEGGHWFEHPRVEGEFHGTGCTLSAAICAARARGEPLTGAVSQAIDYVQDCIHRAYLAGSGTIALLGHPLNHRATSAK